MYSLSSGEDACLSSCTLFLSWSPYLAIFIRLLPPPYLLFSSAHTHTATLAFCWVSCFSIRGGAIMSHVSEDVADNRLFLRTKPISLTSYCSVYSYQRQSSASRLELLTWAGKHMFQRLHWVFDQSNLGDKCTSAGLTEDGGESPLSWVSSLLSCLVHPHLSPQLLSWWGSVAPSASLWAQAIFNAQWNIYPHAETQEDVQSQHK